MKDMKDTKKNNEAKERFLRLGYTEEKVDELFRLGSLAQNGELYVRACDDIDKDKGIDIKGFEKVSADKISKMTKPEKQKLKSRIKGTFENKYDKIMSTFDATAFADADMQSKHQERLDGAYAAEAGKEMVKIINQYATEIDTNVRNDVMKSPTVLKIMAERQSGKLGIEFAQAARGNIAASVFKDDETINKLAKSINGKKQLQKLADMFSMFGDPDGYKGGKSASSVFNAVGFVAEAAWLDMTREMADVGLGQYDRIETSALESLAIANETLMDITTTFYRDGLFDEKLIEKIEQLTSGDEYAYSEPKGKEILDEVGKRLRTRRDGEKDPSGKTYYQNYIDSINKIKGVGRQLREACEKKTEFSKIKGLLRNIEEHKFTQIREQSMGDK